MKQMVAEINKAFSDHKINPIYGWIGLIPIFILAFRFGINIINFFYDNIPLIGVIVLYYYLGYNLPSFSKKGLDNQGNE